MLPALLVIAGLSSWWLIQSEEPRSDIEQTPAQHSSFATADQPSVTTDGASIESSQVLRNTESASATTSAAPEAEPPATQSATGLHLGNTSDNPQQETESLSENTEPEETPRMSQATFSVTQQVQELQLNGEWLASLEAMNRLYNNFEQLNSLEQVTLLNFYTNALIQLKMWQEAISVFTLMLTVPDLRSDLNARTLIALGQLHSRENEPEAARAYLEEWLIMHGDQPEYADQQARVEELLSEL